MKFAVAGASGFVGSALVRRLEAQGHEVLRLVRRPVERPGEIAWHPLSGEVEQREVLEGAEGLVNLSGCNLAAGRWTPERKEEILRSRVESTRTLVTVLAHLNHKPRVFLSASAVGYYGSRGEEELTETSAKGEGFLADVCRTWEEEARIAESVGVRAVILRLGLVLLSAVVLVLVALVSVLARLVLVLLATGLLLLSTLVLVLVALVLVLLATLLLLLSALVAQLALVLILVVLFQVLFESMLILFEVMFLLEVLFESVWVSVMVFYEREKVLQHDRRRPIAPGAIVPYVKGLPPCAPSYVTWSALYS